MKLALVFTMALLFSAPLAAQHSAAQDSSLQSTIDSLFRLSNPPVLLVCVAASVNADSTMFSVDSFSPRTMSSKCIGFQGAVAFIRDSLAPVENIHIFNKLALARLSHFWLVCGMRKEGEAICDTR